MGSPQYHEPPAELSAETRTFARIIASLTEETEAIGWYQQRLALESDATARAIMLEAQTEECRHFCMDLEFLLRQLPIWAKAASSILFKAGDIVENYKKGEEQGEPKPPGRAALEHAWRLGHPGAEDPS